MKSSPIFLLAAAAAGVLLLGGGTKATRSKKSREDRAVDHLVALARKDGIEFPGEAIELLRKKFASQPISEKDYECIMGSSSFNQAFELC